MIRWIWQALLVYPFAVAGICQSNTSTQSENGSQTQTAQKDTGELNIREANRVSLPPPKDVKVKQKGDSVVLEWAPSRQKRVVEYKVFRIDENDGKATKLGSTKSTEFVVGKVEGKPAFGVAAVDYRGNESALSSPVKTNKDEAPK